MKPVFDLLIIADDPEQARAIGSRLGELRMSYRCHYALSGQQALDSLRRLPPFENFPRPNLILLSLHLPGSGADEVLRLIKTDAVFCSIPLICVSSPQSMLDLPPSDDVAQRRTEGGRTHDLEHSLALLEEIDKFWGRASELAQ